jgi:hypothetical protein
MPYWCLLIFQIQTGIVYTFAGLAKLNPDWMFRAMPLKIWLGQHADFPVLGPLFVQNWAHFAMSWFGAFYDLTIFWWLLWSRSQPDMHSLQCLIFHLLTATLFDIGLFPPLMIVACTLFLSPELHEKFLSCFGYKKSLNDEVIYSRWNNYSLLFFTGFLLIQLFLPLRHLFFTNENIRWTQDYYRYGWRVMLVENEGLARFTVRERNSDRFWEVDNEAFLTGYQIKRMSVQPEHIRQFAHYLSKIYSEKYNIKNPIVNVDVQVSLNGRVSKRLIPPDLNLAEIYDSWGKKDWILSD